MKIQGPDQSQKTSSSRKADKAKSSGGAGAFGSLLETSETENTPLILDHTNRNGRNQR